MTKLLDLVISETLWLCTGDFTVSVVILNCFQFIDYFPTFDQLVKPFEKPLYMFTTYIRMGYRIIKVSIWMVFTS